MKQVILTSGPRGTGKTTYSQNYVKYSPEASLLSRDELMLKLLGKTTTNPDTNEGLYVYEKFMKEVKEKLNKESKTTLIVDYFNGSSNQRTYLINEFKKLGADKVFCWKFILPKDICVDWFKKKEDASHWSVESAKDIYDLYYETSKNILNDGFDGVYFIDPRQLRLNF